MKWIDCVRLSSALCLAIAPATLAGAQSLSDPAPIVSAFNETCRRGFPDLETIRDRAESLGWDRLHSAQLVAPLSDPRLGSSDIPELLFKGDMTLILTAPNAVWSRSTCTISVPAGRTLDTARLAKAVSAALGVQASVAMAQGVEQATWHVRSGLVVKASVGKTGDMRRAHLAVLTS